MSERQNNNQNPSGIWQGIWANLIVEFNLIMASRSPEKNLDAWKILNLLKRQIPPECQEDINNEFQKLNVIMNKPVSGYSEIQRRSVKRKQIFQEAPDALLDLMGSIIKSLYERKWISRPDYTATPRSTGTPHIGE